MVKRVIELNRELNRLIGEGEHQRLDFKFCINDAKKIARSLVAFANSDGGILLIGVKDNGRVVGVSSEEEYYMAEAAAKIYSNPSIDFNTKEWNYEGKTVLGIEVNSGIDKPYYARDDRGKWMAYVRVNDTNILAHKIQVMAWKKRSSDKGIHFTFSKAEQFLIDYLRHHGKITRSQFTKLAHISYKQANETLSNFLVMDVINVNLSEKKASFQLNNNFDQTRFDNFC